MNAADLDPLDVGDDAPSTPDDHEWVIPRDRPDMHVLVQRIPDDAPPLIREGLARRRVQAIDGICPCGGRVTWDGASEGAAQQMSLRSVVADHWDECPAGDRVFVPAMLAWRADAGGAADRV